MFYAVTRCIYSQPIVQEYDFSLFHMSDCFKGRFFTPLSKNALKHLCNADAWYQ